MNSFITSYNEHERLYKSYLASINGIKLTFREVDIIACIVHNRGEKKIARICGIASSTVSTHTRNIMAKLECHSKDQIIDFVEKAVISKILREYYLHLLVKFDFEQALKQIAAQINRQSINCYCSKALITSAPLLYQAIKKHLKLANINLVESDDSTTDIGPKTVCEKSYYQDLSLVLLELQDNKIKKIISEFENKYKAISEMYDGKSPIYIQSQLFDSVWQFIKDPKQKKYVISVLVLIVIFMLVLASVLIIFSKNHSVQSTASSVIHSDLIIPEKALLERPDIIFKMKEKLESNAKGNIKAIALTGIIGVGGAGKTTMARAYGKRVSTAAVVWELNAETKDTLINSFLDLAHALAYDEALKNELKIIISNNNQELQEKLLLNFIRAQLRMKQSWLLIYDNIESFDAIAHLFPQDEVQWGKNGSIIVTTRNENIIKTGFIKDEDVIYIDKLSNDEMLALFSKIIYDCEPQKLQEEDRLKAAALLQGIPPFPLDVSLAAYYIKNYMLTFTEYSKLIESSSVAFDDKQARILNEATKYTRTRYGIISSTIKQLTQANPKFKELFFFISLLDSQNIPYELLRQYYIAQGMKSAEATEYIQEFIFNLRKHGILIKVVTEDDTQSQFNILDMHSISNISTTKDISLHRSMQEMGVSSLLNILPKEEKELWSQKITVALKQYYLECEVNKNKNTLIALIPHLKVIVGQLSNIGLSEKVQIGYEAELYLILGRIYDKVLHNELKANEFLKKALDANEKVNVFSKRTKIILLSDLGGANESINELKAATKFIQASLKLCEQEKDIELTIIANNLDILANVHAKNNDFNKAKELLFSILKLLAQEKSADAVEQMAMTYVKLGRLYFSFYLHNEVGAIAGQYLKEGLHLGGWSKFLSPDSEVPSEITCQVSYMVWSYGNYFLYHDLNLEEALKWFREAEYIRRAKCPQNFYLKGRILCSLGRIYLLQNDINQAEEYVIEGIKLLEMTLGNKDADSYKHLLAEIKIRQGKYQEAYENAIYVFGIKGVRKESLRELQHTSAYYHAALAQYKMKNYQKSIEHFAEFIQHIESFCISFLEKDQYQLLVKEKAFTTASGNTGMPITTIQEYLHKSLKIYTIIYGEKYPFVKDYIAPNYFEIIGK